MEATYQSEPEKTTGNPIGMDRELKFAGSTELDNGITVSVMQDTGDSLTYGNSQISFGNVGGLATIYVGSDSDPLDAIDDITPSAYEEANGSGSGSYTTDFGSGMDGSMSIAYSNGDILGTGISVKYSYYPRLDGTTNNEKAASGTADETKDSAESINVGIPLSGVPGIGSTPLGGAKITLGYENSDSLATDAQSKQGGTVAVVMPIGALKVGYQKKGYQAAGSSAAEAQDGFFKDDILGIAYAVNDEMAVSYNVYQSDRHLHTSGEIEQETKAINVAYTVGGLTLAFQDAKTTNSGYALNTDNDTRTISIKTAF